MSYATLSDAPAVVVKHSHDRNGNSIYTASRGSIKRVHKYNPALSREANVCAAVDALVGKVPYRGAPSTENTWVFVRVHQ
jgi:hypothetical protein